MGWGWSLREIIPERIGAGKNLFMGALFGPIRAARLVRDPGAATLHDPGAATTLALFGPCGTLARPDSCTCSRCLQGGHSEMGPHIWTMG